MDFAAPLLERHQDSKYLTFYEIYGIIYIEKVKEQTHTAITINGNHAMIKVQILYSVLKQIDTASQVERLSLSGTIFFDEVVAKTTL